MAGRRALPMLLLAALLVGLATIAPVWSDPAALVPQTRFTLGHLVGLGLGAKGLPWPSHTDQLGWPKGADMAPLLWPALPMARFLGPVLSLDLVFALVPVLNALGGWALAREAGATPAGAIAAGGLLAWTPWALHVAGNGQIEQAPIGAAAAMWAVAMRATRGGPSWLPAIVALATGIAAPHVALAGAIALGAWAVVGGGDRKRRALVVAGVGLALVGVDLVHAPALGDGVNVFAPKGAGGTGPPVPGLFEYASVLDLVTPPRPPTQATHNVSHTAYLGWVPLLAALAGLRTPLGRRALAVAAACGLAACVPPDWVLGHLSQGLERTGSSYRLVVGAIVALPLAASAWVGSGRVAVALVAAAWIETAATSARALPLKPRNVALEASATALAGGKGPVLDLPLSGMGCSDAGWHYAYEALGHGRPIPVVLRYDLGAYASISDEIRLLQRVLASPQCASRVRARVAADGFRTVVLHRHPQCPPPPGLETCLVAGLGPGDEAGEVRWWSW